MQPVNVMTGEISTSNPANQFTAPYVPPAGQTSGAFLGADGFLSKVGETAVDLFGLYGNYEIQKAQISASKDRKDPVIVASQQRAGIIPESFPAKELFVGGAIVAGVSILVIGAIYLIKD